ncbi:two-component sensor histidine kinase [Nocardiopsis sp. HNM0947]|uniref:histidine kinase n=1 Tax=Nocardiopsis coralli TaxID=2772213 RepID=A0ABR9P9B8_9ACTN|nr:ATP-binding protein [Nocardiopsis coralli]MBE3000427.1 two-component sensor histidine kinase [Nocardiopsis coralli]
MDAPRHRRRRWAAPAADLLLWAVLAGAAVAELWDDPGRAAVPESAVALVVSAVAVALSRRAPAAALVLVTAYATAQAVSTGLALFSTTFPMVPLLWQAVMAFRYGSRSDRPGPVVASSVLAAGTTFAANLGSAVWSGLETRAFLSSLVDWSGGALALVLAVVAPWLFARYRRRRLELTRGGWEVAARMERTRAAEADRSRLRERAQIASRMHDSLGHDLSLIAVRAAALEMASGDDPERSAAAAELRSAAHEANLRLREVIGVLREDPAEGPGESVAALVEQAAEAGLAVRLLREGPGPDPDSWAGGTVHRVVREALTNAAKYTPGSQVSVHVVREEGAVRVTVSDTGPGAAPSLPGRTDGEGGLAVLRASVEEAGGHLEAGPEREGFVVRARIPGTGTPAEADDPTATAHAPPSSETDRLRSRAGSQAWRSLVTALVVPVGLGALVLGLAFSTLSWVSANSVLPPQDYDRLSLGDPVDRVEAVLPRFEYPAGSVEDPPPAPEGSDECRFYLVENESGLPPVYRLCFSDGVLADKEEIERRQ